MFRKSLRFQGKIGIRSGIHHGRRHRFQVRILIISPTMEPAFSNRPSG
jgi:hypothetical protein